MTTNPIKNADILKANKNWCDILPKTNYFIFTFRTFDVLLCVCLSEKATEKKEKTKKKLEDRLMSLKSSISKMLWSFNKSQNTKRITAGCDLIKKEWDADRWKWSIQTNRKRVDNEGDDGCEHWGDAKEQ